MSSLLAQRIRADSLAARRQKTVVSGVLSTLLGEMDTKEKTFSPARPLTEDEIIAVIRKFLKSNAEAIETVVRLADERGEQVRSKLMAEKAILETYLPQQLTDAEIEQIARDQVAQGKTMGQIMAYLKDNAAGRYDGKTASAIVKTVTG